VCSDSPGFETGDEDPRETMARIRCQKKKMPEIKDQFHAIWLFREILYAGRCLLEAGVAKIQGDSALSYPLIDFGDKLVGRSKPLPCSFTEDERDHIIMRCRS